MKITENAKKYLDKNNFKNIFINGKSEVNLYGQCCGNGDLSRLTYTITDKKENKENYKSMNLDGYSIYISDVISKGINDNTELDYKKGLFKSKLELRSFDFEAIKRSKF